MQFETRITDDISFICATPLMVLDAPDAAPMNRALLGEINGARAIGQGVRGSNVGGWQSVHDLWQWPGDGAAALRRAVQSALGTMSALGVDEPDPSRVDIEYRAQAWANVNGPGHYNVRHGNPQYDWTAIYIVAGGPQIQPPPAGRLEIHDPRRHADITSLRGFGFAGSMVFDFVPGKLALLPAWMEYTVHPSQAAGDRIWVTAAVKMTGGRHAGLR